MSYVIKKQKYLKSLDKIKEVCKSNNIQVPFLIENYPMPDDLKYNHQKADDELKEFLDNNPEFKDIAINLNPEQEEIVKYIVT